MPSPLEREIDKEEFRALNEYVVEGRETGIVKLFGSGNLGGSIGSVGIYELTSGILVINTRKDETGRDYKTRILYEESSTEELKEAGVIFDAKEVPGQPEPRSSIEQRAVGESI